MGTFHARISMIEERNGKDLKEVEAIKKRWQGHTEDKAAYLLSPCLFDLYAEYIKKNARLNESKAGIKVVGEISITSDVQVIPL